ncbi:MAG: family 10 glycosylhydrolase [Bacteroidetes bacterium]|nr:family 10 glycosylhydrolase [Bacteroidota bacterium]
MIIEKKTTTKLFLISLVLIFLVSDFNFAQSPKREFRGAWIATVTNLDWPQSGVTNSYSQQSSLTSMLDNLKNCGINTVVFQIRTECDAFYNSPYEPWSRWLTGTQGKTPDPFYDPLEFAINEAHKRGIELHAWFNPYRAERSSGSYPTAANHVTKTNPEWILNFSTLKMLDPGLPNVRAHVLKIITDVLKRYNIDGIHFDDYFYPYPSNPTLPNGITTEDNSTFTNFSRGFTNIKDWRRDNVNILVKAIYDSIKTIKPWVKLGMSPFGIWKNGVPTGIVGLDAYNVIYCDPVSWLQGKYIDYVSPQLYWPFGGSRDYAKLLPWWSSQKNGRHLYVGQAAYRITDSDWNSSEIPNQIRLNRTNNLAEGSLFFRTNQGLINNPKGFYDSLKRDLYYYKTLLPKMEWKDSVIPLFPTEVAISGNENSIKLKWKKPQISTDGDSASKFVIYKSTSPNLSINDPKNILYITSSSQEELYDVFQIPFNVEYFYSITALDKLNNESIQSQIVSYKSTSIFADRTIQKNYQLYQNYPNPFNPNTTITFNLPKQEYVIIKIYNLLGKSILTLVDEVRSTGRHSVYFDGTNLPSGVYICRIKTDNWSSSIKMTLQK